MWKKVNTNAQVADAFALINMGVLQVCKEMVGQRLEITLRTRSGAPQAIVSDKHREAFAGMARLWQ